MFALPSNAAEPAEAMPNVPPAAVQPNSAGASVNSANPPAPHPAVAAPEKAWPPPVQMLSPSAALNRKSRVSVNLVDKWKAHGPNPTMGQRGAIQFRYGATQDTVVCAPLRICDIQLQPGEIVQNINLGDKAMWDCPPAISGSGAQEVTHLMCKPTDAGLETTLTITTSRRPYTLELVSTRSNYMPIVSWSYPDDQVALWNAYQMQANGGGRQEIPADGYVRYSVTLDKGAQPAWMPVAVYGTGTKTYIQFPPAMAYGKAPVFERLQ